MTVVRRVVSMALRTLARSVDPCVRRRTFLPLFCHRQIMCLCVYMCVCEREKGDSPLSVLGSATVTLIVQLSQQTSSSPLYHILRRRVFSMNWTDTWPRPPPLALFPPPPPPPPPPQGETLLGEPRKPPTTARACCWRDGEEERCWVLSASSSRRRVAVRWAMRVSSSGSAT